MTLIEMTVAVTLFAAVGAVFLPLLATATRNVRPLQTQSETVDDLRVALSTIGRELRSAECVAEPAANASASNRLRFTTHANNSFYEVTYTAEGGELRRQVTGAPAAQVVATGLVDGADAFAHIATPRRTVRVHFHLQPDPDRPARELGTVMAGRNAWRSC
jgi:type II secretory pathway component PulJ